MHVGNLSNGSILPKINVDMCVHILFVVCMYVSIYACEVSICKQIIKRYGQGIAITNYARHVSIISCNMYRKSYSVKSVHVN